MSKLLKRSVEISSALLFLVLLNLLLFADPGFTALYGLPYLTVPLLFAAFYSLHSGIAAFALMTLVVFGIIPLSSPLDSDPQLRFAALADSYRISYPLSLLYTFVLGGLIHIARGRNLQLRERLKSLTKSNWRMKKKSRALIQSNMVLENRVSGQVSSMSLLYNQISKFSNIRVKDTLEMLLETAAMFIGAEQATVWQFAPSSQHLRLAASFGWNPETTRPSILALNDSIEGWVIRNSSLFSYRMILENELLERLDQGRSIIAVPILIENRSWGVLSIEALPFQNYSEYSEKVLQIIIKLAQPFIQHSVEYERMFRTLEADEVTGLPLYSQFRTMLDREIEQCRVSGGSLSLVIIELVNVERLLRDFEMKEIKLLSKNIVDHIKKESDKERYYFHYRESTQLAILSPNTDTDGTSMLSLEILSFINTANWEIRGKQAPLEVVLGHGNIQGQAKAEDILAQAESLLEMQRI